MTKRPPRAPRPPLPIVIVGHVDHGKSTVIGRLLFETNSLPEGKAESVRATSEKRGMPFEWAFVLDALQAERDQGITIDTTQIRFQTKARRYILIDAPGHVEFLKNMITGAAQAKAALLVMDAEEGARDQTRQHAFLLHLMGLETIAVIINKMDRVGYQERRFQELRDGIGRTLHEMNLKVSGVIPVSAREGENIAAPSAHMAWHRGETLTALLDSLPDAPSESEKPLRFPIQDIYKFDERRIIAGRIESGRLKEGDRLLFSPSNKSAVVSSLESWPPREGRGFSAEAGEAIGVMLDRQLFLERGELASHQSDPPFLSDVFRARIFWLGRHPLTPSVSLVMKRATSEFSVVLQSVERVIDAASLEEVSGERVSRNQVADIILRAPSLQALDSFGENGLMGRFVLLDGRDIAGGGVVSLDGYADQRPILEARMRDVSRVSHKVSPRERELRARHRGGVLWLTGLSGSGKSTLAFALEKVLFDLGYGVYVLDGDNIRHGLSEDLGFSVEDRSENIRRVAEAASLFADAGFVALVSFISPMRSDRARARGIIPNFHEVYVSADLETCEARDPKGLYKRARGGEIEDFTGVSADYEVPEEAELVLETGVEGVEDSLRRLVEYVEGRFRLVPEGVSDYEI